MTGPSSRISYAETVRVLEALSMPVREMSDPAGGVVGVTTAGSRIIGMSFAPDGPNILWTNPGLYTDLGDQDPHALAGGIGGDRLWFAPELRFHWQGRPNWTTFENYAAPPETDPGSYYFLASDGERVALEGRMIIPSRDDTGAVPIAVHRSFAISPRPEILSAGDFAQLRFIGVETTSRLELTDRNANGPIDMWHLLQVAQGSLLIVPIRPGRSDHVLNYGLSGGWTARDDLFLWRYRGDAQAKIGLGAADVTGRAAVLIDADPDEWILLVRDFPVASDGHYADHPFGKSRSDQICQAWDGFGFGELEFHSPAIGTENGVRHIEHSDRLWAFGGAPSVIVDLAERLLDRDLSGVCDVA